VVTDDCWPTTLPGSSRKNVSSLLALRQATTSAPSHVPHCEPTTNVAPEVAIVGEPEAHTGRTASGNLFVSVIGTLWS
jgi:hypothetical protein